MAPRYAIYFVPAADTALYSFGSAALGYDCYRGQQVSFLPDTPADWPAIVREPGIYGFHATLKAPFHLFPGSDESELLESVRIFATDQPVVDGGRMALRTLGPFIALVPAAPSRDIDQLAAHCVRQFDRFRARLTAEERVRRLGVALSAAQIELLDRWGYPYIFEEFRFHMTLTGALEASRRAQVIDFLGAQFEQNSRIGELLIDQIVVARQDHRNDRFRVVCKATLGHSAYRPFAYSF